MAQTIPTKQPPSVGFGLVPTPIHVHPHGVFGGAADGPDADFGLDPFVLRGGNQNPTNTCVWWAIQNGFWTTLGACGLPQQKLSVLGGYWPTRMRTHNGDRSLVVDFGCRPPDAAQVVNELGWIPNDKWPFVAACVDDEPPWDALVSHKKKWFFLRRIVVPYGQRGKAVRHVIATLKRPVLIGQEVDQAYVDWRPGDAPWRMVDTIPKGRHMEMIATYDTAGPSTVSSWGDLFDRKIAWDHVESDHVSDLWYVDINENVVREMLKAA